jgi:molecular chaperone DnaK (HSP70)
MVAPMLERAMEPVQKVLEMAGLTAEQLSAIEICGGATRLVPVQNRLSSFLKRDISKTLNFEEAVARGCALQCAMLSPVFKVREFSVTDINPYPIKLSWKSSDQMEVDESKEYA